MIKQKMNQIPIPNINFITDSFTRSSIENAWKLLTPDDFIYLREYDPPAELGFLWDTNDWLNRLKDRIENTYPGHSGNSMAFTIRTLQNMIRSLEPDM